MMTKSNFARLDDQEWESIKHNRTVRMNLASQSLLWFFHLYFGHYVTYETAPFQKEIMHNVSDPLQELIVIVAARNSAKSTIVTTALPLWGITGVLKKKYVVIASQTQQQAQQHLRNIRNEIEANEVFRKDYGPLEEESNEWGIAALVLPKFNAKIIAISREQGVRGLRHGPNRPDLIIADDVEDVTSTKTREGRNKTYDWFTSEILPLGDRGTKVVVIGNLLHNDSLLMRLKEGFEQGLRNGFYYEYPIERNGKALWPDKYPDQASIERERLKIGNRVAWEREFRLNIVPDEDQIVTPSMLQYYDELPANMDRFYAVVGVDLAISEKDTADKTAAVTFLVDAFGDNMRIYVMPAPVNERLNFLGTLDAIKGIVGNYDYPKVYVENIAYQSAAVEMLEQYGIDVEGVTPKGDKRTRLNLVASHIERATILFPRHGCKELIEQLTGFGSEKYDDLVDAFTLGVIKICNEYGFEAVGKLSVSTKGFYPKLPHESGEIDWDD